MRFRVGQYMEFENAIGRITRIKGDYVVIRRMTKGRSYDYQQWITKQYLIKLHKEKKMTFIDPLDIMDLLANMLVKK